MSYEDQFREPTDEDRRKAANLAAERALHEASLWGAIKGAWQGMVGGAQQGYKKPGVVDAVRNKWAQRNQAPQRNTPNPWGGTPAPGAPAGPGGPAAKPGAAPGRPAAGGAPVNSPAKGIPPTIQGVIAHLDKSLMPIDASVQKLKTDLGNSQSAKALYTQWSELSRAFTVFKNQLGGKPGPMVPGGPPGGKTARPNWLPFGGGK